MPPEHSFCPAVPLPHALAPVQIAYHVPDAIAAAQRFARDFGWGPFYVMQHIPLSRALYRGTPTVFDHTSAYGQAGELMVELIMQHGDDASVLRDRFAAHQSGLHHIACFVPDLAAALAEHVRLGRTVALDARTTTGVDFAMIDLSAELGHMLELYERSEPLERFYAFVRRKSQDWDGSEPVRYLR